MSDPAKSLPKPWHAILGAIQQPSKRCYLDAVQLQRSIGKEMNVTPGRDPLPAADR